MNPYFISFATKIIEYSQNYEFYEYADSGETKQEQIIRLSLKLEKRKVNVQYLIEIYREILGTAYHYKDCVEDEHEEILNIANSLLEDDDYLFDLKQYLKSFVEDGRDTEAIKDIKIIIDLIEKVEKVKD